MARNQRILRRDCGLCKCQRCQRDGTVRLARDVDHVIPLWANGPDDDGNLQAISAACHQDKTAVEAAMRSRGVSPSSAADWLDWHEARRA